MYSFDNTDPCLFGLLGNGGRPDDIKLFPSVGFEKLQLLLPAGVGNLGAVGIGVDIDPFVRRKGFCDGLRLMVARPFSIAANIIVKVYARRNIYITSTSMYT